MATLNLTTYTLKDLKRLVAEAEALWGEGVEIDKSYTTANVIFIKNGEVVGALNPRLGKLETW